MRVAAPVTKGYFFLSALPRLVDAASPRTISISLRKHPFLLALRRWGRFAKRPQRRRGRRNGCFRRLHQYR